MSRRRIAAVLAAWLCGLLPFAAGAAEGPLVQTRLGPVRGAVEDGVASFKGIPFAEPPVGALRWRPPQPARPWTAVRDALEFSPACMQGERTLFPEDRVQSEDCLTLNVWAPGDARGRRLPVMVWIYGGGFSMGSTRPPLYSGANFARDGVVMVSLQYRVGRFGFFAHPALTAEDPDGPLGNFAIMDQIAGLKWVRDNIAAFGGDPENVTIFGESAGGISVNALMATPAARGLFAKAISQSGFGRTVGIPLRGQAGQSGEAMGLAFARARGIEGAGPEAAAALRALPAADVLGPAGPPSAAPGLRQPGGAPGGLPYPMIDGVLFAEQIWRTFAAGRQAPVPYLAGGNSYEASLFPFVRQQPQAAFDATGRPEAVRALYVRPGRDEGLAALDLVTDLQVTEPARFLAQAVARQGLPAFVYHFDYVPPAQRGTTPGAAHGAELGHVFGVLPPAADEAARALSEVMRRYWIAFATDGAPGAAGGPAWPPVTPTAAPTLVFGPAGPRLEPRFLEARLDLLESLGVAETEIAASPR